MSLVLDASMTLSWYFEDERTEAGDRVMEDVGRDGAIVPSLWRYEVANGLSVAIRRRRIDTAYRDASLADLQLLAITIDAASDATIWAGTLHLADRLGLTVYDAAYLELAHRRGLPLATHDLALRSAAQALGLAVLG